MKVVFSKYAKLELEDATHFYELEFGGLGRRFKEEVKKAAIRISEYPKAWSAERGDVRNVCFISSLTSFCIQLKKITY